MLRANAFDGLCDKVFGILPSNCLKDTLCRHGSKHAPKKLDDKTATETHVFVFPKPSIHQSPSSSSSPSILQPHPGAAGDGRRGEGTGTCKQGLVVELRACASKVWLVVVVVLGRIRQSTCKQGLVGGGGGGGKEQGQCAGGGGDGREGKRCANKGPVVTGGGLHVTVGGLHLDECTPLGHTPC